jgi:hypothetical protein
MSKEGSPTVTDTETGQTTFGRPQNFSCGGMGKAVRAENLSELSNVR